MSNSLDRLIYMVNQIARNLAAHPDPASATADHIAHFWDPRMRTMIFAHLAAGGAGLDPVASAALRRLLGLGPPAPQTGATEFNAVNEPGGSDAG